MLEQAFDDYIRLDILQNFDCSSYSAQEKVTEEQKREWL
ncbi:putative transposase [Vibrio cholerae]|nr:hypothetical protein [Vibrio cholerae]GHW30914.1 putative transposase [Vibrio cholerae]